VAALMLPQLLLPLLSLPLLLLLLSPPPLSLPLLPTLSLLPPSPPPPLCPLSPTLSPPLPLLAAAKTSPPTQQQQHSAPTLAKVKSVKDGASASLPALTPGVALMATCSSATAAQAPAVGGWNTVGNS
jgi:hypothetical protein